MVVGNSFRRRTLRASSPAPTIPALSLGIMPTQPESTSETPQIIPLYARFVRGGGWDSKLIEWDTRAWCSHVELIDNSWENTIGAMLKGGVLARSITDPIYKRATRYEIWSIPATNEAFDRLQVFVNETLDNPYDWRSIVSFGLGERDWTEPGEWICSEWFAMALVRAGLLTWPLNLPANRITPRDCYMLISQIPGAKNVKTFGPLTRAA